MARAGGTPRSDTCNDTVGPYCHFDLTDRSADLGVALRDALGKIAGQVLSCEFSIPPSTGSDFDPGLVNVRLGSGASAGRLIGQDKDRKDGWNYGPDNKSVVLYGAACDEAKAAADGRVDIVYGCPTEPVQ